MFLTDLSIKRPVFATVLSLVLVLFGIVTFNKIPLRELPDIETAQVSIRVNYKGASASIIDAQITQKIEDRVGGTPGVVSIESKSEDERATINLEFDLGIDLDTAANDVRDRIARIVDNLPDQADPPEITKASAARTTTMWLAFQSPTMSDLELTDYANRYLKDYFANVDGVGQINLGGERELSLRIWLDPTAMAARNITVQELEDSLRKQNVEFPAGKVESKNMDLIIKVQKAYVKLEDYKDLIYHFAECNKRNVGSLLLNFGLTDGQDKVLIQSRLFNRKRFAVQNFILQKDNWIRVPNGSLEQTTAILAIVRRQDLQSRDSAIPGRKTLRMLGCDTCSCTVCPTEDNGHRNLSRRHVMMLGSRVDNLIDGLHRKVEGHKLHNRLQTLHGRTNADASESCLCDRGIFHTLGTVFLQKTTSYLICSLIFSHFLTHDEDLKK